MKRFLIIIAVFLLAAPANAATFYVRADGTATKANAVGPETDATKCMTLATHNLATFAAGDIIVVSGLGGTHADDLKPPSSGTVGNLIVYRGSNNPVITGDGTYALNDVNKTYVTFTGIIFTTGLVYFQGAINVTVNQCVMKSYTGANGQMRFVSGATGTLNNSIIHGSAAAGIYIGASAGGNVTLRNCLIYGNAGAGISTVSTNTINYDYCLIAGNNTSPAGNLSLGTGAVDGGHNIIETEPKVSTYKNGTAYFSFTFDDADVAYWLSVADAVAPYGHVLTGFVQRGVMTAQDETDLVSFLARGHKVGVHTWTHTTLTHTTGVAVTTTNAAPTINVNVAGQQIVLSTTTPGNAVTFSWVGDKRISDWQAAVAGKGWTLTLEAGIPTSLHLSSFADSGGAQAVPYTTQLDRTSTDKGFFFNEISRVKTYLEGLGATPKVFAFPENAWDSGAEGYLLNTSGLIGGRASGGRSLSSIDIFNVATVGLSAIKGDGTETTIRQLANHFFTWAMDNGYIIPFLAHDATEFTAQQWGWLADELHQRGAVVIPFEDAIQRIKSDHSTSDNITYTKTYSDLSNYRLTSESAAIDAGTTVSGITTDPDGQAVPYSSAPDIGLYEHHDTFVYGKGRLKSGTGMTTVTTP